MLNVKKILAGAAIPAMLALVVPTPKANAQIASYGGLRAVDPISEWIVLNGLFNGGSVYGGGVLGGGAGVGLGAGAIDPIGQWIVLNNLFNGGALY
jgi:hypothetical protein